MEDHPTCTRTACRLPSPPILSISRRTLHMVSRAVLVALSQALLIPLSQAWLVNLLIRGSMIPALLRLAPRECVSGKMTGR